MLMEDGPMNREAANFDRLSRRSLLLASASLLSGAPAPAFGADEKAAPAKLKVAIFSKHLRFLEGVRLADAAAEIGFDGIDLAVRQGGHVEPERVRQDLAPLVAIIRARGLEVPMLTTDIVDAETPHAADILGAMAELGVPYYRWGGLRYAAGQPISRQLADMRPRVARLAEWNARFHACAMYHTHSGIDLVGASIWDLHELLEGFDPNAVGVNYDVGHATVEGGVGGWINSFRITGRYLKGVAIKDFRWEKGEHGDWQPRWTPLGEGMVHFPQFFREISALGFSGPLQLHFEYPLGGAEAGRTQITIDREQVLEAMKRDLQRLRSYMKDAGL
jgi:sugar phosphate isomerase/epimerase